MAIEAAQNIPSPTASSRGAVVQATSKTTKLEELKSLMAVRNQAEARLEKLGPQLPYAKDAEERMCLTAKIAKATMAVAIARANITGWVAANRNVK